LNATSGGVAGTFTYTPASGTVMATAGNQTLSTTFTPTDTTTYTTATATVTLVVTTSGGGGGSFTGPSNGGGYTGTNNGTTFLYRGTTYPITNGRVYFPDCSNYAVIGSNLFAGAQTPNCTPGGGGGGSQTTPTITWATPASVTAGTALSATQLNATSGGVAGTFTYTPASGTVMATAGNQTLSTTFTPTDTTTYTTATATVTLVVTASGGGGAFQGPSNGGGFSGSVSGSNFIYNGTSYPITNGRVYFPDCSNWAIVAGRFLMAGAQTPNCTPGDVR
jgi:hypothetical protein